MDHHLIMQALITHVEAQIDRRLDGKELERLTQYSHAHLRSIFKEQTGEANPSAAEACKRAAELFSKESALVEEMIKVQGGVMGEEAARGLAVRENRTKIIELIKECRDLDVKAAGAVKKALELLG